MEYESKGPQEKQPLPLRTVTAAILGFFPLIVTGYLIFLARADQAQLSIILNYMWVVGLVISAWILYLQLNFLEKGVREFNRSSGRINRDITHALILALMLMVIGFAFQAASPRFTGFDIFLGQISQSPTRLAIFLGPGLLLWALYEELTRALTLNVLWELVEPDWAGKAVIAGSALVFALAYAYQGWGTMAAAGLGGLLLGTHYQKKGRFLPLILAHYMLNLFIFIDKFFIV